MKISEMQKFLAAVKRKHGDIEMIERRFSDYGPMDPAPTSTDVVKPESHRYNDESQWALVSAVSQQQGEYLMRDHRSLTDEQRATMDFKTYLLYKGN